MTQKRIGVAVVGAGAWGANHVRNFHQIPNSHLIAVCDESPEVLRRVSSAMPEVACSTRLEDVLARDDVEAVIVATTASAHAAVAEVAITSGRDVMVEKPLALTTDDAERVVRLAREGGRVLMVGHLLLFHPAVEWLRSAIHSGDLGDIRYVYSQRVNLGKVRQDENALWSLAPHDISVINYLLGDGPVSVSARGQRCLQPEIEDVVFANLMYSGNRMGNLHVSWLDPHKIRRFTIVGSRKMAVFDDMEPVEKIRIYDKGVEGGDFVSYGETLTLRFGDIHIPRVQMTEPLRLECEHFLHCVETREAPKTPGEDGLSVVRVLNAAQASLDRRGEPVELESRGG